MHIDVAIRSSQPSMPDNIEPTGMVADKERKPVPRANVQRFKAFALRPIPADAISVDALLPDLADDNVTKYLANSVLSVRPKPKSEPEIELPPGWLEAFGLARLTLYISAEGKVDAITFVRTDLPAELQAAVRDAFQKVEFSPGEIDGRAVATTMTIETNIALMLGHRR